MRITYWARVDVPTHGDVITEARQFPRVRLNGTVTFQPIDSGTRLTERLNIAAPRLLAAMTEREAVNAHVAMLAGIRGHFEKPIRGLRQRIDAPSVVDVVRWVGVSAEEFVGVVGVVDFGWPGAVGPAQPPVLRSPTVRNSPRLAMP